MCNTGIVLYNIFIKGLELMTKCILVKFADDTKMRKVINMLDGRAAIQRYLERLEEWASQSIMKFNQGECKFLLHFGRKNSL